MLYVIEECRWSVCRYWPFSSQSTSDLVTFTARALPLPIGLYLFPILLRFGLGDWLYTNNIYPQVVTHISTDWGHCKVALLVCTMPRLLGQTGTTARCYAVQWFSKDKMWVFLSQLLPLMLWIIAQSLPSVLWRCWLGGRKGIRPVKNWVIECWHGYLPQARCWFAYDLAGPVYLPYVVLGLLLTLYFIFILFVYYVYFVQMHSVISV